MTLTRSADVWLIYGNHTRKNHDLGVVVAKKKNNPNNTGGTQNSVNEGVEKPLIQREIKQKP